MQNKTFRVALIYDKWVTDMDEFNSIEYSKAHAHAIEEMKNDKTVVSALIYSNRNTAIVLKRKYADT